MRVSLSDSDMVRTRANAGVLRAVGGKATRKNPAGSSSFNSSNSSNSDKIKGREHSGGNAYFPRETPEWQKPITSFFNQPAKPVGESSERREHTEYTADDFAIAGTSKSNVLTSFKEDTTTD